MIKQIMVLVAVLLLAVAPVAVAQDFCQGNFDYDDNVDGGDAAIFKTHFGRNSYENPCPPDGPTPVPKTGQIACYDDLGTFIDCSGTGQDGEHQKGFIWPNPRFTDNLDGTITDNLTGLIWLKDVNCSHTIGHDPDASGNGSMTWQHALDFVAGINDGTYPLCGAGHTDWRLPHIKELLSLIDYGELDPALPSGHPFLNELVDNSHWSSSSSMHTKTDAWIVFVHTGHQSDVPKSTFFNHVWPVRGGH